jgi:hypothetical protein
MLLFNHIHQGAYYLSFAKVIVIKIIILKYIVLVGSMVDDGD